MKSTATAEELLLLLRDLKGFWLEPRIQSGADNMAMDQRLMASVQANSEPVFLLRAYGWQEPTLSLGVNQPEKDLMTLSPPAVMPVVRRPTGGRAIWHGEDYSYAFISNSPVLLRLSVKDSYCIISQVLKQALKNVSIETVSSEACTPNLPENGHSSGKKSYTRSPECFTTQMPDDLIRSCGSQETQKIAGSAQCRKAGVLLQHGSVYLKEDAVSFENFSLALQKAMESSVGHSLDVWSL